jgi:hypothetical protein
MQLSGRALALGSMSSTTYTKEKRKNEWKEEKFCFSIHMGSFPFCVLSFYLLESIVAQMFLIFDEIQYNSNFFVLML